MSKAKFIAIWLLIGAVVFLAGMMLQEQTKTIVLRTDSSGFNSKVDISGIPVIDTTSPNAVELTRHFIEQMPEKAATNADLLKIYLEAYKQFAHTIKFAR